MRMKVKLMRCGNGYAFRMPKSVMQSTKISEGTELFMEVKENGISLMKLTKKAQLSLLLKHLQPYGELDMGMRCGREVW
jgi:antitoxin component of MazEF toxin-antitoxin module